MQFRIRARSCGLLVVTLIAATSIAAPVRAVQDEKPIDLEPFRVPSSPAFTLLGVAPTNIDRPIAPRDFFTSIVSSLDAGTRDVPTDLALEFSPYWWFDHKELTYKERYERDPWETAIQTFSISIATTEIAARASAPNERGTRLGLGTRLLLMDGTPCKQVSEGFGAFEKQVEGLRDAQVDVLLSSDLADLRAEKEAVVTLIASMSDPLANLRAQLEQVARQIAGAATVGEELWAQRARLTAQLDALERDLSSSLRDLADKEVAEAKIVTELRGNGLDPDDLAGSRARAEAEVDRAATALRELDKERYGWTVELASAGAVDFVDGDAGDGEFTRTAGWLTAGYTPSTKGSGGGRVASSLTFLGVARYIWDGIDDRNDEFLDVGARAIWRVREDINLSTEYLLRNLGGDDETERWAAVLEFQVSEGYALVASFGSDFETSFEGDSDLIASIGFSVGIGGPQAPVR
ncbi:hypothetical protein [Engelhardtia mirabilis]|uniref:Uncharacterized protein n=1 Tax=Engelhardtia mirabilis TaxID=2528011 RepID=A0A518BHG2_9BACT|nr:hypothetical protein Pla133_14660 [Planctomycetes bacterium Pla133]QDV00721.1 hypothetical protein Pla86_14650 [Planctomycetes bacterium Pla86]